MSDAIGAHRRYNPLLDEWVLCSPHRLHRPWQGRVEPLHTESRPAYDRDCYLCPGNERARGARNPSYEATFVFDNDYPALTSSSSDADTLDASPLLRAEAESGRCRVLCFTRRHDLTLARMSSADIRLVIDAASAECVAMSTPDIGYVQLFENKGELMGCSNPHPHAQIWATRHVPTIPARKASSQRRYFAAHGSDLLGDYLDDELRASERIVFANAHWVVIVPFWAVWPFQTIVLPRRRVGALDELDNAERDALAMALKQITVRYDALFQCDFPYSMGWAPAPANAKNDPSWRLHAEFLPPLLRSATVRKFMVGYELMAEAQRDFSPEEAAARLRDQSAAQIPDTIG